jgi:hypothetical protein
MKKRIVAVIAGGIWLSAVGSAALLTYALDRPLELSAPTRSGGMAMLRNVHLGEAAEETVASSTLELPTSTIVGNAPGADVPAAPARRSVAEMQGGYDVIIGPGVVTHP